jgi:polyribonucleotide nucleotidyltransferase
MMHRIERTFAGRPLIIETGRMAKQAAGSALVTFGETVILAAVTVSDKKSPLPFFPLTVEYKEKTYAAGKIAGGFIKREGRPRDEEILSCRIIDRSIRPLFPEGFQNEVQVVLYVLSADQENDADVLGLIAASFALSASKIPFAGPIAGVRVGRVEGKWLINPTFQALEFSDMDMIVAGSKDSIMMVEGGALEVTEEDVVDGLKVAQKGLQELVGMQEELLKKLGKIEKMEWKGTEIPADVRKTVVKAAEKRIEAAINQKDKATRIQAVEKVKEEVKAEMAEVLDPAHHGLVGMIVGDIEYDALRAQVLDTGLRVDGRKPNVVRDISVDTSVLPRTHGSALFTRGQTQALVVATLGTAGDAQRVDSIDSAKETTKSFMLHYNFPPFSTGEAKPMRGTGRREIGHGMLAERAIQAVLPSFEEFP